MKGTTLSLTLLLAVLLAPARSSAQGPPDVVWAVHGHAGIVNSIAVSRSGAQIASGGDDGFIRIWSARDGYLLHEIWSSSAGVWSLSYSPNSKVIAAANAYDGTVKLFDARTGALLTTWATGMYCTQAVAYSPDGSTIAVVGGTPATGAADNVVQEWSVRTGTVTRTMSFPDAAVSVAFSPNGRRLAVGSRSIAYVVDRDSWTALPLLGHSGGVGGVAFSHGRSLLATGGEDSTVRVWDSAPGQELAVLTEHTDLVPAVAVSQRDDLISVSRDRTIWVHNLHRIGVSHYFDQMTGTGVDCVVYGPGGAHFAYGTLDGFVVYARGR